MAPAWAEEDVINRFDHLMFRAVAALGCGATDSVQATRFDSWAGTDVHMISSAGFTALFIVVSRHHADALGTRRGATALGSRQRVYYTWLPSSDRPSSHRPSNGYRPVTDNERCSG